MKPLLMLLCTLAFSAAVRAEDAPASAEKPATSAASALPAAVDLRADFARFGLKQRSQGRRGTCSVFSVVEAVEFAVARATGTGGHLSVEFSNWAANEATGRADDGDFFSNILKGLEKHGVCPEEAMPYRRKFAPTAAPGAEAAAAAADWQRTWQLHVEWLKPWRRQVGLSEAELARVKQVLAGGHPVCGGSPHSILFVGYADDAALPGGGKLLISDSNLVEKEITYAAAMERFNDLLWLRVEKRKAE